MGSDIKVGFLFSLLRVCSGLRLNFTSQVENGSEAAMETRTRNAGHGQDMITVHERCYCECMCCATHKRKEITRATNQAQLHSAYV